MRALPVAVLVAAALLAAAPGASAAPATARLVAVTAPPPEHRADPGLKAYVFRFGPHRIGPYQVAKGTDVVTPPPVDGAVVAMDTRLVTGAGAPIPQWELMLHHIVYSDGGPDRQRRDGACPGRPSFERFFGTSEELRPLTLPRGYGYPVAARDHWRAGWMVMNHRADTRSALIEYRVTVDPNPALRPVKPLWLSVLSCARSPDPQFSVPGGGRPGSVYVRARSWRVPATGRIVALGGHMHGGARRLEVAQPGCGGRAIFTARPAYATASDPLYAVRPLLHEPDPKDISWTQSTTGWAVRAGDRLRVRAVYDDERPHMRVMGIAHVYLAPDTAPGPRCGAPPADAETLAGTDPARAEPPAVRLTLARFGRDGLAHPFGRPPGPVRRVGGDVRVRVEHYAFSRPNLSIAHGRRITWRFGGGTRHDATLASGPQGFASPQAAGGATWSRRFTRPGAYRIYCSLHPVYMAQYVHVR
jgi:plastocyanin